VQAFVARQAILDRRQEVFGHELLFRSSLENRSQFLDATSASSKVISDSAFLMDLEVMTGGKKAFINATTEILVGEYATLLPKRITVLEILESVAPDAETIVACEELKRSGYELALDDFVWTPEWEPLVRLADYIKLDILASTSEQRTALIRRLAPKGIRFIAEKVETPAAFECAQQEGFELFQGYFFRRPQIIAQRDIPASKLHYVQLLAEINRPAFDIAKIEAVIKRDVAFSYKLLRCMNAASVGLRQPIKSVRQALVYLGEDEVRKWASLIAMAGIAADGPRILLLDSVTLARFCELLAQETGLARRDQELYLLGMLSMVDVILGRPLPEILGSLPVAKDVRDALLGNPNPLRDVYEYGLAYERGDWNTVAEQASVLGLNEQNIPELYRQAIEWCGERLKITSHGAVHAVAS